MIVWNAESLKYSIRLGRNSKGSDFDIGIIREIDIWSRIKLQFNHNLETDSSLIRKNKASDLLKNVVIIANNNNILYALKISK